MDSLNEEHDILLIGDSIMFHADHYKNEKLLENIFTQEEEREMTVLNLCSRGDRTQDLIKKLGDDTELQRAIIQIRRIIIHIGTNNLKGDHESKIYEAIVQIIEKVQDINGFLLSIF